LDAWGAWGLKKSRFEVKKAGVNACAKQTSAVQDRLEAGGLQNGIGKCTYSRSQYTKNHLAPPERDGTLN
jgi:hypothetical protein